MRRCRRRGVLHLPREGGGRPALAGREGVTALQPPPCPPPPGEVGHTRSPRRHEGRERKTARSCGLLMRRRGWPWPRLHVPDLEACRDGAAAAVLERGLGPVVGNRSAAIVR